jgi:hypothetical protein
VLAAIRLRVKDHARVLDRLLNWSLAKPRTEVLVTVATLCSAGYFLRALRFAGLMGNFEKVLATAALIACPAMWLREARNVPPAHRRRHTASRE